MAEEKKQVAMADAGPIDDSKNDERFKNAFTKLKRTIGDLSSLEVQTYVGTVVVPTVKDKDGKDATNFEDFLKACVAKPENLSLVAVTKMSFDGDAINLVPAESFPDHVQKVHESAVKAGIETRHGLLSLFGSLLGLKAQS